MEVSVQEQELDAMLLEELTRLGMELSTLSVALDEIEDGLRRVLSKRHVGSLEAGPEAE